MNILVMQLTKGLLLNLICLLVKVGGQTEFPQLSLTLPNHDYITVGSIKHNSVQCHTGDSGNCPVGNWILPDGTPVSNTSTAGMYQHHSQCRVDLRRMGNANVQSGIYHCEVAETTNSSLSVPVYIGIYSMGQGEDL